MYIKTFHPILILAHHILAFKLALRKCEFSKFPWKFEGSEDGVFAREGDEGGRGEGAVGVDSSARVTQTVLAPGLCIRVETNRDKKR